MPIVYDPFARFYDLEYSHKEDDLPFYLDVADTYGAPVLEIGAGTGRVTFEIARAGHEIWGIDDSARMLAIAVQKQKTLAPETNARIHLQQADMRTFDLPIRFPLCIIPFRAFLHNLTREDQLATLHAIHRHLLPGGILAFDLFVPVHQVLSKGEWHVDIPASELADPAQNVSLSAHITHDPVKQGLSITNIYHTKAAGKAARERKASMKYRYIFQPEMELLLLHSGFTPRACYGGFLGEPYDFHSGIMCFIAEKMTTRKRNSTA